VQVFGFAGAGYNRFDLTNSAFNNGQLKEDNTFVLPAGGGLQINFTPHLALDGRFTYRAMFDEDLMGRNHNADMYTATGRIGYLF
jgi:opacity protein-like surface antigen